MRAVPSQCPPLPSTSVKCISCFFFDATASMTSGAPVAVGSPSAIVTRIGHVILPTTAESSKSQKLFQVIEQVIDRVNQRATLEQVPPQQGSPRPSRYPPTPWVKARGVN